MSSSSSRRLSRQEKGKSTNTTRPSNEDVDSRRARSSRRSTSINLGDVDSHSPSTNVSHRTQQAIDAIFEDDETFAHQQQIIDYEEQLRQQEEMFANVLHGGGGGGQPFEEEQGAQEAEGGGGVGGGGHVPSSSSSSDEDVEEVQAEEVRKGKKHEPKVLKSNLFTKHFRKVKCKNKKRDMPEQFDLFCNYCDKKYKFTAGGGYGTYRRHISQKHPREEGIPQTQSQLHPGMYSSQGASNQEPPPYTFTFNENKAKEEMAKFICIESLAFQFADSIYFEHVMKHYQPAAKRIARTTMTRTIRTLVRKYRLNLRADLRRLDHRLSICSDIWKDCVVKNYYMGITCHWIDNAWNLNKRIIAYRKFNKDHTAQNIARLIIKIAHQFRINDKIFSIGFDNASANIAAIRDLIMECNPVLQGKYFHCRCICHILNLSVQDGMRVISDAIEPIRNVVSFIHSRPKVGKKWAQYCKTRNIRARRFPTDVSTRWNSTYEMLNATFEYKDYLVDFFRNEIEDDINILSSHWDACCELNELLQAFCNATKDLSGVYYPTSPKVLYHFCFIAAQLNLCSQRDYLKLVIVEMTKKWLKYFKQIPDVFLVAKCLDPSMKYTGVCSLLDAYYGCFYSLDYVGDQPYHLMTMEELDLPNVEEIKSTLRITLENVYDSYATTYAHLIQPRSQPNRSASASSSSMSRSSNPLLAKLQSIMTQNTLGTSSSQQSSELDIYLLERYVGDCLQEDGTTVDLLQWWSRRQQQYPILCMMAKEFLAVPASTVAVEQAFSVGGYVLDERRSNLTPQNLEAQILLKDWAKAEMRAQENDWKYIIDDEEVYDSDASASTAASDGLGDADFDTD